MLIGIRGIWDIFKQVSRNAALSSGTLIGSALLLFARQIWIGIRRTVEAMERAAHGGVFADRSGFVRRTDSGCGYFDRDWCETTGNPFTACRKQSSPRACPLDGLYHYSWDGFTVVGVLPTHGNTSWTGIERTGIGSACRSSVYLLLWHDGDGDTTGRFGGVYGSSYRGHRYHANRGCCVSVCVGGIRAALRFCPKARTLAFIARWGRPPLSFLSRSIF